MLGKLRKSGSYTSKRREESELTGTDLRPFGQKETLKIIEMRDNSESLKIKNE